MNNRKTLLLYYLSILSVGFGLLWLVDAHYNQQLSDTKRLYISESHEDSVVIANKIEKGFTAMYEGLRTIARIPGVRSISRHGENFDASARITVQEIYNNLATDIKMSEVYIVPRELDPDRLDPTTGKPQVPITTFDELIVGKTADTPTPTNSSPSEEKVEEIEIYEYRLMREQLAWLGEHFPREQSIRGLAYPAISGAEVITCDNSHYSPSHPNDKERSGIVYSVPFFDSEGEFKGSISGVILTSVLADYLPTGDYALINEGSRFAAIKAGGTAKESLKDLSHVTPSMDLLYSEIFTLPIVEGTGTWKLWVGLPNENYFNRNDVQSAKNARAIESLGIILFIIGLLYVASLIAKNRRLLSEQNANLEAEVALRTRELEKTTLTAQQHAEEAQRADRAKSIFLAIMSHEIRTPIHGVMGMVELALEREDDANQRELLLTAEKSASMLLGIINDILDFSKIEAGKLEIAPRLFEFNTFLEDTVAITKSTVSLKEIAFILENNLSNPCYVIGDDLRLRQIITNLISNGVKFTPEEGAVIVQVKGTPRESNLLELHICISDTGIGLSEKQQRDLFKPFTQADSSTTRRFGGTGLGLSIAKQLVELMDGSIWVASKAGIGSVFQLRVVFPLPTADELLEHEKSNAPRRIEEKVGNLPLSSLCRVLLAEDNPVNQTVAKRILEKRGYAVTIAQNGAEVLTLTQKESFDIILMDCHMPILDGFEATQKLREHEKIRGSHLPIIALTANALKGDRETCLASGMDDFLPKPFKAEELIRIITKWTGSRDSNQG